MENTTKSFEISYPENAHEAFATENTPLPAEIWNEAWDAEIEAEKTNQSLLKRISDAIPTPVKAAAAGTVLATTRLLSPESAEAIPQEWHPVTLVQQQNRLHENTFVNNDFDTPEQLALAFKNNMMRGEGVRIETRLDVLLSRLWDDC